MAAICSCPNVHSPHLPKPQRGVSARPAAKKCLSNSSRLSWSRLPAHCGAAGRRRHWRGSLCDSSLRPPGHRKAAPLLFETSISSISCFSFCSPALRRGIGCGKSSALLFNLTFFLNSMEFKGVQGRHCLSSFFRLSASLAAAANEEFGAPALSCSWQHPLSTERPGHGRVHLYAS